ncbi:MAG: septum formation initiator family protein [Candidatus Eisenbacteria sp.]|nr:septum formation initiator family protein [Candidatus Eisenbacteria bacterium]
MQVSRPRNPFRGFMSRDRVGRTVAVAIGLWLLWVLLAGDTSLVQLWKLKHENADIRRRISEMESHLEDLDTQAANLADAEYLEKFAREKYGMIRDGETSYRLVPVSEDQATSD